MNAIAFGGCSPETARVGARAIGPPVPRAESMKRIEACPRKRNDVVGAR
jgi:hypothetical protein